MKLKLKIQSGYFAWYLLPTIRFGINRVQESKKIHSVFITLTWLKGEVLLNIRPEGSAQ